MKKLSLAFASLVALFLLVFFPGAARASHAVSADFQYVNIAPNTYSITYRLTFDKQNVTTPQTLALEYEAPGCHNGGTVIMNGQNFGGGIQPCTLTTFDVVYMATLTLPASTTTPYSILWLHLKSLPVTTSGSLLLKV